MIKKKNILGLLCFVGFGFSSLQAQEMITVYPLEYSDALSNPLKGFRPSEDSWSQYPYPTVIQYYIEWNEIENDSSDGVDKIIDFCNTQWAGFEEGNIKVIPRVYLDWDSAIGNEYWPADLKNGDWRSDEFKERVVNLIHKLGEAWDTDPRVAWVQTGIIGYWGEQGKPVGVDDGWAERMGKAFAEAFPNKLLLVRNQPVWETEGYEMGVYWDSFAHPAQRNSSWTQILNANTEGRYLTEVVEGEVAYNWGEDVLFPVIGESPDATVSTPKYYNYLVDVIREVHCSALGWVSKYNPYKQNNLVGASEIQKAFGYRFVIDEFSSSKRAELGGTLDITLKVQNTGSAPFYENWPLAFVLIDETTEEIVFTEELPDYDVSTWYPGSNYDYSSRTYLTPAVKYEITASVKVPSDLAAGQYMAGFTILEPYSRTPGVFFAVENFLSSSQSQPLAVIGIGQDVVGNHEVDSTKFADPLKDDNRIYSLVWSGPTNTLTTSAETGGSISPGSKTFNENQNVRLKATAELGYEFSGWSGDLSGTENPIIITMDSFKNITANFVQVSTYTITKNASNGFISLDPNGGTYNVGTVVMLAVNADLGYVFSGWSGDLSGADNPATLTMDADKNVTANFNSAPIYTLTTSAEGGSIVLDPVGPEYTEGSVVKVTAIVSNSDINFLGWSGDPLDYASYINPNSITMDADKSITANFIVPPEETGLWVETFTHPDRTAIDSGSTAWTATRASGVFEVIGNRFTISAAGPEGMFTTSAIDISAGSVDVSVEVEGAGGLEPESNANRDYFGLFKKVDGGAEQIIYENYGAQSARIVSETNIIGSTLELVIRGYATANDEFYYFDNLKVTESDPNGIYEEDLLLPLSTQLTQNYPNPFNPQTTIKYQLSKNTHVSLKIYNLMGELVKTLLKSEKRAGYHEIQWNGKDNNNQSVSSGIYIYYLNTNDYTQLRKMILLK